MATHSSDWYTEYDVPHNKQISFLVSMLLHMGAFLILALVWKGAPRGEFVEPDRAGSIVLVRNSSAKTEYFSESTEAAAASQAAAGDSMPAAFPDSSILPVDIAGVLPTNPTAGSNGTGSGVSGATSLLTGGSSASRGRMEMGKGSTYVFGLSGVGNKFVYVFDRSASMAGYQGRPLAAAKRELVQSLNQLDPIHQFQIIFYNDRVHVFNPNPTQSARLLWADDSMKRAADRYISGTIADGGTKHLAALKMALGMGPDVIFFLTDADDPQLSNQDLAEIQRWNRSAAKIHAIQFGAGVDPGGDNFLKRLARQNQGKHAYVDVTALRDSEPAEPVGSIGTKPGN